MTMLSIPEVLAATEGMLLHGDICTPYDGYAVDSRRVKPGNFYIPLVGKWYDGNDFIADVMERGAAWSLVSDLSKIPLDKNLDGKGLIFVPDTFEALQRLAGYVLEKKKISLIQVVGGGKKNSARRRLDSLLKILQEEC